VKINQSITGTASIAVTKLLTQHRLRVWFPLVIFLLATFFIAYPVSRYPASLIYGRPFEDAFEAIGVLYWYKHALFDLGQFPLFRPDVFYPFGWDLRFTDYPWLYPLLVAPITAVAGPVLTYNLAILGSCVFSALGMFMVVRAVGGGMGAGILAGLAFAFYPQREVYLAGFFNFLTLLATPRLHLVGVFPTPIGRVRQIYRNTAKDTIVTLSGSAPIGSSRRKSSEGSRRRRRFFAGVTP